MITSIRRGFAALFVLVAASVPALAQFSDQRTWGGTSAGSANAQTVAIQNVGALSDILGVKLRFIAGFTNTGATTIAVSGKAATAAKKVSPNGLVGLSGGEIVSGNPVEVMYDGTEFMLSSDYTGGVTIGTIQIAAAGTADSGYLLCFGQAVSRTTYASLFTKIGTAYGAGDGSTTFNLPDLRGRMPAGLDNMGGTAANRITSAGSGVNGSTLGAAGGVQNTVVQQANLASFSLPANSTSTNTFSLNVSVPAQSSALGSASGQSPQSVFTSYSVTGNIFTSTTTTVTSGGTSTPMTTLSNTQIVAYEIKY